MDDKYYVAITYFGINGISLDQLIDIPIFQNNLEENQINSD